MPWSLQSIPTLLLMHIRTHIFMYCSMKNAQRLNKYVRTYTNADGESLFILTGIISPYVSSKESNTLTETKKDNQSLFG